MLNKLQKPNKEGFTIIEVMIVLAIAALILLIVLLAVPALQRGSRNTQRKNDASQISAAYANFLDNNGGIKPTGLAVSGSDTLLVCSAGGTSPASGGCSPGNSESAKLGYYDPTMIYGTSSSGPFSATDVGNESATTISVESVTIDQGYKCNGSNTNIGDASPRSAAILYATETSGSSGNLQCIEQ